MTLDEEIIYAEEVADRCYECTGYGDDYYLDENGEWVKACDDCIWNECGSEE